MSTQVTVVGTGFVGSAVAQDLRQRGVAVRELHAPRLSAADCARWSQLLDDIPDPLGDRLLQDLAGSDVVVNAAGLPDASSADEAALDAANGWLPVVLATAAVRAGAHRMVHISSAAVQGRRPVLDETAQTETFSPYSRSKVAGEERLQAAGLPGIVVYRPPGVHAAERRVTRLTARIARSPLATVLAPGDQPSPQALLGNVASAVGHLATCCNEPPGYVIHPWEGLTSASLLEALGGRSPRRVPRPLGQGLLRVLTAAGRLSPQVGANARRVEMLWAGQRQARSWLTEDGWEPPLGPAAWREMGEQMRATAAAAAKDEGERRG